MIRILIFSCIIICISCNTNDSSKIPVNDTGSSKNAITKELTLSTRYKSFDTTVEVIFTNTSDSMSECQKRTYEKLASEQDILTPDILKAIFKHYLVYYPDYRKGATMNGGISRQELEKFLPTPTKPENLKPFITPAVVYIPSKGKCEEGTFGIEFDCSWDPENGLGVLIKNWKVDHASIAEIAYQQ